MVWISDFQGYRGKKCGYITMEHPKHPAVAAVFWRVIWQENINLVVMLDNGKEEDNVSIGECMHV